MAESESPASTGSVPVGNYRLDDLQSAEGVFAAFAPDSDEDNARQLAQALAKQASSEPEAQVLLEGDLEDADAVTSWCEKCVRHFNAVAQGKTLDPAVLNEEINAALGLLQRFDKRGQHEQTLRLARDLCALLALCLRWLELLRSLEVALRSARALGDREAEAWALHQLGTLQLVAGDVAAGGETLRKAFGLRDTHRYAGRCATRHNLDACNRDLAMLKTLSKLARRRRFQLVGGGAILALLATGGVALGLTIVHKPPIRIASSTPGQTSTPSGSTGTGGGSTTTRSGSTSTGSARTSTGTHRSRTSITDTRTSGTTTGSGGTTNAVPPDRTKPKVVLLEPADASYTNNPFIVISGLAGSARNDLSELTVTLTDSAGRPIDGSPRTTPRQGSAFQLSVGRLSDGTYITYVQQADGDHNVGLSETHTFTVDTVAPKLTLSCSFNIGPGTETCSGTTSDPDQTLTLQISHAPQGKQQVSDPPEKTSAASSGTFTFHPVALVSNDDYTFVVAQTDRAGNPNSVKQFVPSPS